MLVAVIDHAFKAKHPEAWADLVRAAGFEPPAFDQQAARSDLEKLARHFDQVIEQHPNITSLEMVLDYHKDLDGYLQPYIKFHARAWDGEQRLTLEDPSDEWRTGEVSP